MSDPARKMSDLPLTASTVADVPSRDDRVSDWIRREPVAQEPRQTAANEWGTVTYYPEWKTLELKWGQKTRSMTDDGFKKTLKILADEGIRVRPSYMIVDMTEFFHEVGEGTLAWRDEHIIPLYNEAGVQKFAFL